MKQRLRLLSAAVALGGLVLGLAACAPAWNWRELRLASAGVAVSFPCKPMIREERGTGLAVCEAHGWTFSLAWEDLERGDRVLEAVAQSAQRLGARLQMPPQPLKGELSIPAGALPASGAGDWQLGAGPRQARLLTWGRGTQVLQALVQGAEPPSEEALVFFSALRPDPPSR